MCGLFCACVGFKLSLISNDAFKNKINPIRKVHFNKENINFFEQSKNTLLRPPSHYLKFGGKKKNLGLSACKGERKLHSSLDYSQDTLPTVKEKVFSHTAEG